MKVQIKREKKKHNLNPQDHLSPEYFAAQVDERGGEGENVREN
jgi:hypothetical protein